MDIEVGDPWNLEEPRKMKLKNRRGFVHFDVMEEKDDEIYRQIKRDGFEALKARYEIEIAGNKGNGDNGKVKNKMNIENVIKIANHFNISQKDACSILGYNLASFKTMKSQKLKANAL